MHLTSEAPNAYMNHRASHQSQQHLDLFQRSVAGFAKPKDEQRTNKARDHCRRTVLIWFESHRWEYLESKYLNNGERGIHQVKEDLKLLLLAAMDGDEFLEDRRKPNYQDWIENQVMEAIFNSMVAYVAIFGAGVGSSDGSEKSELMQVMEKWRDGICPH